MVDKEMLMAIREMMQEELQPINKRLEAVEKLATKTAEDLNEVKTLSTKTAVLMENDVATNISLLQEDNDNIMRKLKRMEKLPQVVNDIQSDVSVIKNVVAGHSKSIDDLKKAQ